MDNNGGSCSAAANTVDLQDEVGRLEQDQLLPIANVGRIMKKILPRNAKISKEAKERMQECASEFISFVTSEASEKCRRERRKTVHGDDICWAFGALGMDDYVEPLKRYLERYREQEGERADQDRPDNNTTEDQGMLNQFSDHIQRPHNGSTGL